jgi:hypothetical protein
MTEPCEIREAAVQRLKARRGFIAHLAIYWVVNVLIVLVWALSDAVYFWPGWAILGWGSGLALHGWSVFLRKPISEAEIRWEMTRVN